MSDATATQSREGGFRSSFKWEVIRSTPPYAFLVAGVAALGGMLFGYDIGVISGAENLLKSHWQLSAGSEELAVSAVLIGAIIGGVFGGKLADKISRRYALIALAAIYSVGAVATALSPGLVPFVVFRIVVGIAVGASSMIVPTYIAELAPRQIRGVWLMTAELFPNRLRGIGASTATVANWSANLLITLTFLTAVDALGKDVVFWIYAAFAAVGIVFARFRVPETKDHSLEDIDEYWTQGRRWPERSESSERSERSERRKETAAAAG